MNEAQWRIHVAAFAADHVGVREGTPEHLAILEVYNNHKPLARNYKMTKTDAWCACFVSAVAILADCADIIPTEVSCTKMLQAFQASGDYTENDNHVPETGDVCFYNWDNPPANGDNVGNPDHVGIVREARDGVVYVIEGNYDNAVKVRKIAVGDKRIRGYGLPDYASKTKPEVMDAYALDEIAEQVIEGLWGNNPERRKRLTAAGYDYEAVQQRVNELVKINVIALEVIDGKWGNNPERRKRLTAAGYDYEAVQQRVNEILED